MKYAILENSIVKNIAIALAPIADNWVESGLADIGDIYNPETGEFLKPAKPINELREDKRNELKAIRDNYCSQPIDGIQVARTEDRENIQGAIAGFDSLYPQGVAGWIGVDNTIKMITKAQLESVASQYIQRKAIAFQHYGELLAALNTTEEISAISWGLAP